MGVGRFQLGFFKVLYLQRESNSELSSNTFEGQHTCGAAAALAFALISYQTATLSAVVAETIEPATRGIARATACRCTDSNAVRVGGCPSKGIKCQDSVYESSPIPLKSDHAQRRQYGGFLTLTQELYAGPQSARNKEHPQSSTRPNDISVCPPHAF